MAAHRFYIAYNDDLKLAVTCNSYSVFLDFRRKYKQFKECTRSYRNCRSAVYYIKAQFKGYAVYNHVGMLLYSPDIHAISRSVDFTQLFEKDVNSVNNDCDFSASSASEITTVSKASVDVPILNNSITSSANEITTVSKTSVDVPILNNSITSSASEITTVSKASVDVPILNNSTADSVIDLSSVHSLEDIADMNSDISAVNNELTDILIHNLLHLDTSVLTSVFADYSTGIVCTDGSYKDGKLGYAYILVTGGSCYQDAGVITGCGDAIRAEIVAARHAMAKALALGVKQLILCYDCATVFQSIQVDSKSLLPEVIEYRKFYSVISKLVNVKFVKVKGHSGIPLHTGADVMAGLQVGRVI